LGDWRKLHICQFRKIALQHDCQAHSQASGSSAPRQLCLPSQISGGHWSKVGLFAGRRQLPARREERLSAL
jgi:hypothetical protein